MYGNNASSDRKNDYITIQQKLKTTYNSILYDVSVLNKLRL